MSRILLTGMKRESDSMNSVLSDGQIRLGTNVFNMLSRDKSVKNGCFGLTGDVLTTS